jgi:hypothetical protein
LVLAGAAKQSLLLAGAHMNAQGRGGRLEPSPHAVRQKNKRAHSDMAPTVPPSSVASVASVASSRGYSPTAQHVLGDPNGMDDESSCDDPHRGSARVDRRIT